MNNPTPTKPTNPKHNTGDVELKVGTGIWTGFGKVIVGSDEWKILRILRRNHSTAACPHQGNCLNERQALEAILAIIAAREAEAELKLIDRMVAKSKAQNKGMNDKYYFDIGYELVKYGDGLEFKLNQRQERRKAGDAKD